VRRPRTVTAPIAVLIAAGLASAPAASAPPRAVAPATPPRGWADCGLDFQTLYVSGTLSCAEGFRRMARVAIMDGSEGSSRSYGKEPFAFEDMTCRAFYESDGIGGEVVTAAGCAAPNGQMAQSVDQRQLRTAGRLPRIGLPTATGSRPAFCPAKRTRGRVVEHLQQGIDCATTRRLVGRFRVQSRPDGDPRKESYCSGAVSCYLIPEAATVSRGRYVVAGRCQRPTGVSVRFAISRRATAAERRAVG
jgi:hypothetical protein